MVSLTKEQVEELLKKDKVFKMLHEFVKEDLEDGLGERKSAVIDIKEVPDEVQRTSKL